MSLKSSDDILAAAKGLSALAAASSRAASRAQPPATQSAICAVSVAGSNV